jgi:hypothetical protein
MASTKNFIFYMNIYSICTVCTSDESGYILGDGSDLRVGVANKDGFGCSEWGTVWLRWMEVGVANQEGCAQA